jgi:hypothetical protein
MKLNIYSQCFNVDLTSPTYITSNKSKSHRPPVHEVRVGNAMRSGFIIKSCDASDGALIYRLQRKHMCESTEICKHTSNAAHLLVIWRISESGELYADILLAEHDKGFGWNKDDLEGLYYENFDRFRLCSDSATETWLLDDNTTLMTMFEIMNEGRLLNVNISEIERDDAAKRPAYIDSER